MKSGEPPAGVAVDKVPGHWLLASLGKRVLRPGGLELTRQMLTRLRPSAADDVVEFAPGMGVTARLTLAQRPRSYCGIEREETVAQHLEARLGGGHVRGVHFIRASAEATTLASGSATLIYGEAMLSMQTPEQKARILAEAFRVLQPGGRYGIHELALLPDAIGAAERKAIEREMSMNIHVGVRPATVAEWRRLLQSAGFKLEWETTAPMHLLEPRRLLSDEGWRGALRIACNMLRRPGARGRVLAMRRVFRRYAPHLSAVAMVCVKPAA